MYVFMKRAAGGGLLTELGASNPVATGQVSARGTTLHFSYDGANAYKTGVFYHLISRASIG
jgi:hypothetical protein